MEIPADISLVDVSSSCNKRSVCQIEPVRSIVEYVWRRSSAGFNQIMNSYPTPASNKLAVLGKSVWYYAYIIARVTHSKKPPSRLKALLQRSMLLPKT